MINKNVILHIDIDSFFVSAEVSLRPELKNKDVAICSKNKSNSIASALSYSAKNKGAKVPMKISEIKKICPNLICIEPNFNLYFNLSNKVFDYLQTNYSKKIEIGSIDEWFLDVSDIWKKYGNIYSLALNIQNNIQKKFKLDVSIGISYNKFLAKMSTDLKKPLGISITSYKNLEKNIWPLPIGTYWGIGTKLENELIKHNIKTIGDLAKIDKNNIVFKKIFKNQMSIYIDNARGNGQDKINLSKNELDTIGNSLTFESGLVNDTKMVFNSLKQVSYLVEKRLKQRCVWGKKVVVGIKFSKFNAISTSLNLDKPINEFEDIYQNSLYLLNRIWDNQEIIGLSISVSSLTNIYSYSHSVSIFDNLNNNKNYKKDIHEIIYKLNEKIGKRKLFTLKEYKENKTLSLKQSKYLE